MVAALAAAREVLDARPVTAVSAAAGDDGNGYVFDPDTLAELDQAADQAR
jgi:hypothetical protein